MTPRSSALRRLGSAVGRSGLLVSAIVDVARVRFGDSQSARVGLPISTPLALCGTVWVGSDSEPFDGVVLVDEKGRIASITPAGTLQLPDRVRVIKGEEFWIGPGIIDTHAHLAFGGPAEAVRAGVLAVRDLGAPQARARGWQTRSRRPGRAYVAVSGPILTAPRGYPSRTWGTGGFAYFVADEDEARTAVHSLAATGVDLIKVALEPGPGWAVLRPKVVQAITRAAHDRGLPVIAHALSVEMVTRALDGEVDELAHTPTELLPPALVERMAAQHIIVSSTIQTFFSDGIGVDVAKNAAALVRAGVRLVYGTDLGNSGTTTGVDPRELDRLAQAGLGRLGALQAATSLAAQAGGLDPALGVLQVGEPARCVVLRGDPLIEPGVWRSPAYVLANGTVIDNDIDNNTGSTTAAEASPRLHE